MEKKSFKMPKTLGGCADALFTTRNERLAAQKKVDDLKALEYTLEQRLIDELPKSDARGVSGRLCTVKVQTKVVPTVEDWDVFYAYVKKQNAFDLMQRRVSATAVEARWEDGKDVPGVGRFTSVKCSVTKL